MHNSLKSYGIDAEKEITDLLVSELSKSIDMEIMRKIRGDHRIDKIKRILNKIKNGKQ